MRNSRWLNTLAIAISAVTLSGCGSTNIERSNGDGNALVRAIPGSADAYTETERCLPTWAYDSVEIAGDEHLIFFGRGDDVWVNKLSTRCPGLDSYDALSFDLRSDRVCKLDLVTGVHRNVFWWQRGVSCSLGDFSKVNHAQAQLLRDAL